MTDSPPASRYRFGLFEADSATAELRRQGVRVKLNAQPFQVLCLLLDRPGELLTREEIARELWPDGTFVDFEHGVNSAVNRIREALGDNAGNPRFVETLARRGYRFVAPVERIGLVVTHNPPAPEPSFPMPIEAASSSTQSDFTQPDPGPFSGLLASPHDLPTTSYPLVQTLFLLLQLMYLAFYVGALANLVEIEDLFAAVPNVTLIMIVMIVTAAILIPVRAFVICMILFHAPRAREKFLKLWRLLLPLDEVWALAPFLLLHHINFGLALSCTALLVFGPFVQRSLVLMGAGQATPSISPSKP